MVGRVAGEQTYYYNVSTGETRYDKPEEFMLEDDVREHHNFLKFQLAAETHAKKVGELQVEVERLQSVWKSTSESGSRYVGTAALVSAQTWTRSPMDTLDRIERETPHADHDTPQIEAQVEL